MPSLETAMNAPDMDRLERVDRAQVVTQSPPAYNPPQFSPFLRCPMPIASAPDAQRQYYRDGVPQTRIIVPTAIAPTIG